MENAYCLSNNCLIFERKFRGSHFNPPSSTRKIKPNIIKKSFTRKHNNKFPIVASGSSFGDLFKISTFGESHGKGVGCVIDGIPPRLPITEEEIQYELDRRRPGQSKITTPRKESDTCEILSGKLNFKLKLF